jgi:hypothetical protein
MLRPSFEKQRVSDFRMQCSVNVFAFAWHVTRRESPRNHWRGARLLIALNALVNVSACSNGPVHEAPPIFGTAEIHPPPKPGDSISHTQMCECKVCDPASCCEGPDDDAPPNTRATCGDSYDFSANPDCGGLAVKSCTSRCTREIWRVRVGRDCSEKRPDTCCTAG